MKPDSYDVVIVTYNSADVILSTLKSVFDQTLQPNQVIIADSNSQDDTLTVIKKSSFKVRLIELDTNVGFGKANNRAFQELESEFVLLVNPDLKLHPECAKELVNSVRKDRNIAVASPVIKLGWGKDSRQNYGFGSIINSYGFTHNSTSPQQNANCFTGACCLMRTNIVRSYGFDQKFFLYYEEPELAIRLLKAGYRFSRTEKAVSYHLEGHSGPKDEIAALGFRQSNGIPNRWYMIGKHWPIRLLPVTLLFNLIHLLYYSYFYVKNRQFSHLSVIYRAPFMFILGCLNRAKSDDVDWDRHLIRENVESLSETASSQKKSRKS